jgi:photosystem II stability/assembly factor-like uncharacterized protein
MRPDDVRDALGAMASDIAAPHAGVDDVVARGRLRVRRRRLTLTGSVALLLAIVVGAAAIARSGHDARRVESAPTFPQIQVVPQTTTPADDEYVGPVPIPLAFVSPTEGWMCSTPTMEYTTDAGVTWTNVTVPSHPPTAPRLQMPVCAAAPNGYAWMVTTGAGGDGLQVIRVSRAGHSVEQSDLPPLPDDWTVRDLAFADSTHGWAFAQDRAGAATVMFVTTDGGRTWQDEKPVRRATLFASATEGWAVPDISPDQLTHTRNGGRTWDQLSETFRYDGEIRPIAARGDTVVALQTGGVDETVPPSFQVSIDDGDSWIDRSGPSNVEGGSSLPYAAGAVDAGHWQLGAGNRLFTTADQGRTWIQVAEFAGVGQITAVHFLTPDIGFVSATGLGPTASGTVVLQTKDAGDSWSTVDIQAPPMGRNGPINFPGGIIGCPTRPLTPPPSGDPPAGLVDAATAYVGAGPNGWTPDSIVAYRIGDTSKGQFGGLFQFQVGSCGEPTMGNAWAVELHSNGIKGQAYIPRAYLALAHYADGWHVFGNYP